MGLHAIKNPKRESMKTQQTRTRSTHIKLESQLCVCIVRLANLWIVIKGNKLFDSSCTPTIELESHHHGCINYRYIRALVPFNKPIGKSCLLFCVCNCLHQEWFANWSIHHPILVTTYCPPSSLNNIEKRNPPTITPFLEWFLKKIRL